MRAVFPNDDGTLLAGLFGRVPGADQRAARGPAGADPAVGTNQGQKFVLVVNDQNEVEYRAVDVGQVHDGLREVMRYRESPRPAPTART